jgi:hypothetical protein
MRGNGGRWNNMVVGRRPSARRKIEVCGSDYLRHIVRQTEICRRTRLEFAIFGPRTVVRSSVRIHDSAKKFADACHKSSDDLRLAIFPILSRLREEICHLAKAVTTGTIECAT